LTLSPELCAWLLDDEVRSQSQMRGIVGESHDWMDAAGMFEGAGNILSPLCSACDNGHRADSPRFKEGHWETYCPEAGWFRLEEDDVLAVRMHRLNFTRGLGRSLKTDRDLPFDRFAHAADFQGKLFDVGNAPIAKAYRHVLVSYFPGSVIGFNQMAAALSGTRQIRQALILSVAPALFMADLPFGHQLVWIGDVCTQGEAGFEIDQTSLSAWASGLKTVSRAHVMPEISWQEDAVNVWWGLHGAGKLNKNAASMGRQVHPLLAARRLTPSDAPEPKRISDELRSLHRQHYPKS
jgi:hypothetical protein